MKTITIVAIGFVLLVLFGIGAFQFVYSSSNQLAAQLDAVEASVQQQQWDSAKDKLNVAQQKWDKTKPWWSVLIDHQEIDNIDIGLRRLEKYVETQGMSLSMGEISTLQMLVEHISDLELPNLTNIL